MRSPSHLEAGHPVMAVKGGETAAAYGRGYRARTLHEAMGRIAYPELDLSHLFAPKMLSGCA